jgi:polysaccharide export outer membrane protein
VKSAKPGIYAMPGDQVNLFQALGLAGDLTFYGRRDNVLFIRETNGKRQFARLDLTKPETSWSLLIFICNRMTSLSLKLTRRR